jgi:hypothetical protein
MALLRGWWGGDMGCEAELSEEHIEEAVPLVIVRVGKLKGDRNVRANVHGLEDSGGRNCGASE